MWFHQKDSCFSSDCKKTYDNSCFACAELDVLFYESRQCEYSTEPEPIDIKCQANDREANFCTEEWAPVCGVTEICMSDLSSCRTYSNGCFACQNKDVNYHRKGECLNITTFPEPIIDPAPSNPFFERSQCQNESRPSACVTDEYFPVCGFIENCDFSRQSCFVTKNNKCEACLDKSIIEYTEGECPQPTKCDPNNRPQMCTMEYRGVCQVKSNCQDGDEECYTNTGTPCQACGNPQVESYYDYECYILAAFSQPRYYIDYILPTEDNEETKETYYCKDDDRDKGCTLEYRGVCAHKSSSCTADCELTAATFCSACTSKDIEWVESGVCVNALPTYETVQYAKDLIATAIGGVNTTGDKTTNSNNDDGVVVAKYNSYSCKDSDRKVMCDTQFKPVCAYKQCDSGYCPVEKSNLCFACLDENIDYVVENECKVVGNSRVYISCSEEERVAQCLENSVKKRAVCGRYNNAAETCTDSSCQQNFNTVCAACGEITVKEYYEGECYSIMMTINLISILLISLFAF